MSLIQQPRREHGQELYYQKTPSVLPLFGPPAVTHADRSRKRRLHLRTERPPQRPQLWPN